MMLTYNAMMVYRGRGGKLLTSLSGDFTREERTGGTRWWLWESWWYL